MADNFEIALQAGVVSDDIFAHAMKRKAVILFMADGKEINKSDIITLEPEAIVKKEYGFDGRSELEAVVIDAETNVKLQY